MQVVSHTLYSVFHSTTTDEDFSGGGKGAFNNRTRLTSLEKKSNGGWDSRCWGTIKKNKKNTMGPSGAVS
jgi:hypothetical protein